MSTFEAARTAMAAELRAALLDRDCARVEAAAVWLRSTGWPLVDVYEVLLEAALEQLPPFATTPEEHLRAFEVQECVRDLVARLAPRQQPSGRGDVLIVVPGGSRWVLGTAALAHVLEDAGFNVVASPQLELDDVEQALASLTDPVGLGIALHDAANVPQVRETVRRVRLAFPQVRVLVGGEVATKAGDVAGLVGAQATTTSLRQTLAALGAGANPLSPRERAVLACVAQGMSNPDAGQHLGVAPATIKTHLDRVFAKLGTSDRTATVALAMRRGWLE